LQANDYWLKKNFKKKKHLFSVAKLGQSLEKYKILLLAFY